MRRPRRSPYPPRERASRRPWRSPSMGVPVQVAREGQGCPPARSGPMDIVRARVAVRSAVRVDEARWSTPTVMASGDPNATYRHEPGDVECTGAHRPRAFVVVSAPMSLGAPRRGGAGRSPRWEPRAEGLCGRSRSPAAFVASLARSRSPERIVLTDTTRHGTGPCRPFARPLHRVRGSRPRQALQGRARRWVSEDTRDHRRWGSTGGRSPRRSARDRGRTRRGAYSREGGWWLPMTARIPHEPAYWNASRVNSASTPNAQPLGPVFGRVPIADPIARARDRGGVTCGLGEPARGRSISREVLAVGIDLRSSSSARVALMATRGHVPVVNADPSDALPPTRASNRRATTEHEFGIPSDGRRL